MPKEKSFQLIPKKISPRVPHTNILLIKIKLPKFPPTSALSLLSFINFHAYTESNENFLIKT